MQRLWLFFATICFVIQRLRERLVFLLIAFLPFHAFMVTVGTRVFSGPNKAPLSSLALWKEGVLALILLLAVAEIIFLVVEWKMENGKWKMSKFDLLDLFIVLLLALACLVHILNSQFSILNFLYGFKYDFIPLVAFLVLRRASWSKEFGSRVSRLLIWIGGIVALVGIVMLLLPQRVFELLGYSSMHSLYVPDGPIAAFQQIGSMALRRMQSVMSGPNQLGIWLLIPFAFTIISLHSCKNIYRYRNLSLLVFLGISIFLTFSRSALIAAFLMVVIALFHSDFQDLSRRLIVRIGAVIFFITLFVVVSSPDVFIRAASTREHLIRPMKAVNTMIANPLGLGLGSAGPASNRVSDACVFLPEDGDASWAEAHPELCVFLGDTQALPADRQCKCPFLPENWYLQIGVELGIAGFILFLLLVITLCMRLAQKREGQLSHGIFLAFLGISIAALSLHAWEGSAVAYTLWILMAVAMRQATASDDASSPVL